MENLALYRTEPISSSLSIENQYLKAEVKRLKAELDDVKAVVYQQKKTISNQARTIKDLNKNVIKKLEANQVVFNKDKVTFLQAFGMKCSEKGILAHLRTFLGTEPTWDNLTSDKLQEFNQWLRKSARTKRGTLLNDSTACTYIAQLRLVIKYGYTDSADSSQALKSGRAAKKKKVWLKPSDLDKLLDYKPNNDKEAGVKRAFLICSLTGCRVSDIPSIRVENIQNNTLRYIPFKTKVQECNVKLTDFGVELLSELLSEVDSDGYCVENEVLKMVFKQLGFTNKVDVGTPNKPEVIPFYEAVSFHTARRTFATYNYRYSILSEREIAIAMGHSSFSQTYDSYIMDKSVVSDRERLDNASDIFVLTN